MEEDEASWAPLGALLGPPGSFLGASWRPLGSFRAFLEDVLEGSWAVLEASCGPFGPS